MRQEFRGGCACDGFDDDLQVIADTAKMLAQPLIREWRSQHLNIHTDTVFDFRLVDIPYGGRQYEIFVAAIAGFLEPVEAPTGGFVYKPEWKGHLDRGRVSVALLERRVATMNPSPMEGRVECADFEIAPWGLRGREVYDYWRRVR